MSRFGSRLSDCCYNFYFQNAPSDGEGVELTRVLSTASDLDPLPSLVVEVEQSLEVDADHERWKDVGTDNTQLLSSTANANRAKMTSGLRKKLPKSGSACEGWASPSRMRLNREGSDLGTRLECTRNHLRGRP